MGAADALRPPEDPALPAELPAEPPDDEAGLVALAVEGAAPDDEVAGVAARLAATEDDVVCAGVPADAPVALFERDDFLARFLR